jgi:hypothetical protein
MGSWRVLLAPLAGALTMVCVVPYLLDTVRGSTRPQRMSWFVFTVMAAIASVSQFAAGASAGAWLTAGAAVGFAAVFIVSVPHGEGGLRAADLSVLAVAAAGLLLWGTTGDPLTALLAIVAAEVAAIALTVAKAYRAPSSETPSAWVMDAAAGALTLLAVSHWTFRDVLYPVHHLIVNLSVLVAIYLGRRGQPATRPAA